MKITSIITAFKKHKVRNTIILCIVLVLLIIAADPRLTTTYYEFEDEKITSPIRFALITDLHSCYYGSEQKSLINAIEKAEPDVILLSGDIFDDKKDNKNTEIFIENIAKLYPCYYATGNHETWNSQIDQFKSYLSEHGVTVLSNEKKTITVNGQNIEIAGVDDPSTAGYAFDIRLKDTAAQTDFNAFSVLLSHRPELIDEYNKYDFDLVVSGHGHGGQWRLPFMNIGLVAPNQGLFPKFTSGLYDIKSGKLAVSRGLARESTPVPRFFNRPEVVIITVL